MQSVNTNSKLVCTLANCGGIVGEYVIYFKITTTSITDYLDIDLSGATAFNLKVFAC